MRWLSSTSSRLILSATSDGLRRRQIIESSCAGNSTNLNTDVLPFSATTVNTNADVQFSSVAFYGALNAAGQLKPFQNVRLSRGWIVRPQLKSDGISSKLTAYSSGAPCGTRPKTAHLALSEFGDLDGVRAVDQLRDD